MPVTVEFSVEKWPGRGFRRQLLIVFKGVSLDTTIYGAPLGTDRARVVRAAHNRNPKIRYPPRAFGHAVLQGPSLSHLQGDTLTLLDNDYCDIYPPPPLFFYTPGLHDPATPENDPSSIPTRPINPGVDRIRRPIFKYSPTDRYLRNEDPSYTTLPHKDSFYYDTFYFENGAYNTRSKRAANHFVAPSTPPPPPPPPPFLSKPVTTEVNLFQLPDYSDLNRQIMAEAASNNTAGSSGAAASSSSAAAGNDTNSGAGGAAGDAAAAADDAVSRAKEMAEYEKERQNVKDLLNRRNLLTKNLQNVEHRIADLESKYLESTPTGNILTGFDNYIKGAGAAAQRRKTTLVEQNRVFSRSSISYNPLNQEAHTPASGASTPGATPISASFARDNIGGSATNAPTPASTTAESKRTSSSKKKKEKAPAAAAAAAAAPDDSETDTVKKVRTQFGASRNKN